MSPVQVEIRTISKRGGSLTLNIPTEFARKMGIKAGSPVVFQYDQDTNSLLIEKVESINTVTGREIPVQPPVSK